MLLAGALLLALALGLVLTAGSAQAAPGDPCPNGDCGGGGDTNSPPTVGANSGSIVVNEGQTANNTGTYSDPDGNATVTLSASSGTVTKDAAGSGTWSWSFVPNDGPDQSQTVTITASDGTDSAATTFSLTVNNVAPTVNFATTSLDDASEFFTYGFSFSVSDPGTDTWTLNTGCGANGHEGREDTSWVTCKFLDGPGSSVVSATATDSDGAARTSTVNVNVINSNPQAVLNAPTSVNEGQTATISLTDGGMPQQDGVADTNAGFRYAFDCNGGPLGAATYANSGTASSTTCTYDDNGTKTVRARIIDKDGGFNEYTRNITVNNVRPTATFNAPASVNQGDNFTISLANVSDPGGADTLSYFFDCDNGAGYVSVPDPSKVCSALDKPTMTVRGKVTDDDGGVYEDQKTVTVNNVNPTGTIQINNNAATTNNATVNLTLSATDPLPGSGVGHMRFRNENTETWSAWEPYGTGRSWLLSSGDGAKTVFVQYRDNAQNVSAATISDDIQLDTTTPPDTTPPETTITSGPSGNVTSTSASFSFSSEPGATFECKLDGETFAACNSPKDYTGLSDGTHSFSVRARDAAGNVDASPASGQWSIDTIAPTVTAVTPAAVNATGVAVSENVTATFSEAMDGGTLHASTFTLFRQGVITPVSAHVSYDRVTRKATLDPVPDLEADAAYTATVEGGSGGAKDAAGNPLATDRVWSFTTAPPPDTTPPNGTVVIDGDAPFTTDTRVTLTLSASDPSPGTGMASMRFPTTAAPAGPIGRATPPVTGSGILSSAAGSRPSTSSTRTVPETSSGCRIS